MPSSAVSGKRGTIRVERRTGQDLARRYSVVIDEETVGRLWAFQKESYEVAPGVHTLQLKIPSTGRSMSDVLSLAIEPGEECVVRTIRQRLKAYVLTPIAMLYPNRFAARPWIRLAVSSAIQPDGST